MCGLAQVQRTVPGREASPPAAPAAPAPVPQARQPRVGRERRLRGHRAPLAAEATEVFSRRPSARRLRTRPFNLFVLRSYVFYGETSGLGA